MADHHPTSVLTLQLNDPWAIQDLATSETINFGGFMWQLEVRKVEANDAFDLFVHCHPSEASVAMHFLWMCLVDFKICIQQIGHKIRTLNISDIFFFNDFVWSNAQELQIPPMHWNFDGKITIVFNLLKMRLSNLGKNMPALDTTLCMEFDGRMEMVLVNKSLLAVHSTYFCNLFNLNGQWENKNDPLWNDEFIIREEADFNINAFRLMLNSAQLMGWMVHLAKFLTDELAVQIVKMSIKYNVPMLTDYGENYLINASNVHKMEMLSFAEEFGLFALKEHCLATMAARDYTMDLDRSAEIRGKLSKETRQKLDARLKARDSSFGQRNSWGSGPW